MLKEFKEFIARGNVFDLAVAVVIGAAFSKIIDSFVSDIIMPPIGLLTGDIDFSNLYLNLSDQTYPSLAAAQEAGAPTINYGAFVNVLVQFLIVALAIFMVVKGYIRLKRNEPVAPTEKECPFCLNKIPLAATRCGHCTSDLRAAA